MVRAMLFRSGLGPAAGEAALRPSAAVRLNALVDCRRAQASIQWLSAQARLNVHCRGAQASIQCLSAQARLNIHCRGAQAWGQGTGGNVRPHEGNWGHSRID